MNVDLLSLINNEGQKIDFEGNTSFYEDNCNITCDVNGNACNFAGRIEIKADVNAIIKTQCSRCLKPLDIPFDIHIDEVVGEDDVELNGSVLEFDNIVKNNILVKLPIRFLCSDDCKGICSICGTDLNVSECNCKREQIDERFAVLKKLLNSGNKPE
ncbi:MAG: DUF177 domain-containing protein [Clostridia bacterium]|nr:DUF177 domain-containing protein [Clostridia bacterium]